jgi:RimJ/RimL family protein N-acetyltransferase
MLELSAEPACRELGVDLVIARVKENNTISARVFASAGFQLTRHLIDRGVPVLWFERRCLAAPG